jgi:hypothetical protein
MQPSTSHAALAGGVSSGRSVHAFSTHEHVPGADEDAVHVAGCDEASTQRVGLHGSSQPQSVSLSHATNER